MIPNRFIAGKPSETELRIELINGSSIFLFGLDRPERIEGQPVDGGIIDEYANCKPDALTANIRPMLSDRRGWLDLIGVPEGYGPYHDLYQRGLSDAPEDRDWSSWTWWSEAVLPAEEIEAAKRDLPAEIYRQEYQAEFISFSGQAYYSFDRDLHVEPVQQLYSPENDLILCLDFNVSPGVAVVLQRPLDPKTYKPFTAVLWEAWIERGSNTQMVMQAFLERWRNHPGELNVYGDQTGGAVGTSALLGSDWDIVTSMLEPVFGSRLWIHRPGFNPSERARLNAMNTHLKTASGEVGMKVDPDAAPHVIEDLERTPLKDDGSGKIDKNADQRLSHLSDALGYYVFAEHPMVEQSVEAEIKGF